MNQQTSLHSKLDGYYSNVVENDIHVNEFEEDLDFVATVFRSPNMPAEVGDLYSFSKSVKHCVAAEVAYISKLRQGLCNSRSKRLLLVDHPTIRVVLSHDASPNFLG